MKKHARAKEATSSITIVGVGASAGGLEAFKQLLEPLPARTGLAFVLVQHLDPTHVSLLGAALGQASKMPIVEARDGARVALDHVYVMPSNAMLTIRHGVLRLTPRPASGPNLPIDIFFRSLAKDAGSRAIAVVLSGTAHDGTLGLEAIKADGGTTIVQAPESAKFDGMPRSAIEAGAADLVLAPAQIAAELLATRGRVPTTVRTLASARTESALGSLFVLLRNATRVDFSGYKRTTILRRVARRLAVHKLEHLEDYLAYVAEHPGEVAALHDDLLIHVTQFFRDPESFEALSARVLPAILARKGKDEPIRVWVAGCSTGEEVYSLAMLLTELATSRKAQNPIQIFGSDVSETMIARARAGIYSESALRDVGEQRLKRFFTKNDTSYRVQKSLRELCVFVCHDVTSDPPFSKLDLVSCRNLLIYFDAALQKKTIPLLHYALDEGGVLVLGRSETIASFGTLFALDDKINKFYVRRPGPARTGARFRSSEPRGELATASRLAEGAAARPADLQREMDQLLLARYAPAGVIVNSDLEVLHFRGRTGRYLEPPPGQATFHLLKMAREGLLLPLRDLLAEVKRTGVPARRANVVTKADAQPRVLNLEAVPLRAASGEPPCYLVLFEDAPEASAFSAEAAAGDGRTSGAAEETALRRELAETKSFLESLGEQHEATNEELTSANEELLSGNEELQSTNEELNTAKEELQSSNEELTTVNDELHSRNQELSRLNDDLVNLVASVDIPIVILDRERKIRRFTPTARTVLHLIPTDLGRPIGDINPTVDVPLLDAWIAESIETLKPREAEVKDRAGHWYRLQIRPYRTSADVIDGAVVSFVDVDALKRTIADAVEARDFAKTIVETVPIPTLILDGALNVMSANAAFYSTFALLPAKTAGKPIQELTDGGWLPSSMREPLDRALATKSSFELVEVEHELPRLGKRTMMLTGRIIGGDAPLVLIAIQDVTDVKRGEENRLEVANLEHANQEKDLFLAMLSHELRTPLNSILLWSQVLRKDPNVPESSQRAIMGIESSAKAQSQIVDDLLDVSRMVSGKLQITRSDVDLGRLVKNAVDTFHAEAVSKQIALEVDVATPSPHVAGDPKRLRQVVWNLLSNALKFTPASGRVAVRLDRTGGSARIAIEDDGIGIDPAFLPRVFERFAQQDSTTTRAHGGMGLGLGLARHIVELHDGTIRAENNDGAKGVRLTVEIPVITDGQSSLAPPSLPIGAARGTNVEGLRVLVVDDDSECRAVIAQVLTERKAVVQAASSAQQARAALATFLPDILVCDAGMPGETGIELMRWLRTQPATRGGKIPAAALTAYVDADVKRAVLAAGFQLHLAKPIEMDALVAAVDSLGAEARRAGTTSLPS